MSMTATSVPVRTGAAQYYHPAHKCRRPPPQSPDFFPRLILIVTTCLYKSALMAAELGRCLHP